jgi:hypothetical protein
MMNIQDENTTLLDNQINLVVEYISNVKRLNNPKETSKLDEQINLAVNCFTKINKIKAAFFVKENLNQVKSDLVSIEKQPTNPTNKSSILTKKNLTKTINNKFDSHMDAHLDSIANTIDYLIWQTKEIERIQKELEYLIIKIEKFNMNNCLLNYNLKNKALNIYLDSDE